MMNKTMNLPEVLQFLDFHGLEVESVNATRYRFQFSFVDLDKLTDEMCKNVYDAIDARWNPNDVYFENLHLVMEN